MLTKPMSNRGQRGKVQQIESEFQRGHLVDLWCQTSKKFEMKLMTAQIKNQNLQD